MKRGLGRRDGEGAFDADEAAGEGLHSATRERDRVGVGGGKNGVRHGSVGEGLHGQLGLDFFDGGADGGGNGFDFAEDFAAFGGV